MIAILDNIRSIHNVGSIFRTADAVGVDKLYLCGITPAPVDRFGLMNAPLVKVALGAEKTVAWRQAETAIAVIAQLRRQGKTIVALEQHKNARSLFDSDIIRLDWKKTVLVVGAEVEGIAPEVLTQADYTLKIPMHGKKESLNVSVAFGIAAYVLRYRAYHNP